MDIYTFSSILEVIFLISIAIMIFLSNEKHNKAALIVFIADIILLIFIVIVSNRVEKGNNFEAYAIPVTHIQETEREEWGDKVIRITDDTGKTEEVAINETKYDADTTYVEMKRFKCLFIYKDKNVLHIKAN
jgi:hypothetical protein